MAKEKATMVFFSGDLDRALAGMIIALGAAASSSFIAAFFFESFSDKRRNISRLYDSSL